MLKRFMSVVGALASVTALMVACSGQGDGSAEGGEGEAQVSVRGLSAYEIQSMVVTAQPANVSRTLTYQADAGTFTGTLVLPAGTQTLTANGYAYVRPDGGGGPDAGSPTDAGTSWDGGPVDPPPPDGGSVDGGGGGLTLVASGTATVEIVANTTAAVTMQILDLTPPSPQPDFAPIIRSASTSGTTVNVNQLLTLSVDAVDFDNDPISYAWTSDCPQSLFTNPFSQFTQWGSPVPGACTLRVTATARGQSASLTLNVTVFGNQDTGGVQVVGEYIPRPRVGAIAISGPNLPYTYVSRGGSTANLPNVRANTQYRLEVAVDYGTTLGTRTVDLTTACGSMVRGNDTCAVTPPLSSCFVEFLWTPNRSDLCRLTARATNQSLVDTFTVGTMAQ